MKRNKLYKLSFCCLAILSILINASSCIKASSPKWSFSFDIDGKNHSGSGVTVNASLVESCQFDSSNNRLTIMWGSLMNPEQLVIKFPSDKVGVYSVDNINSWMVYSYLTGSTPHTASSGARIEITSVSTENVMGTFSGNLGGYAFSNGTFKAIKN
jgi:hypothetical protein